MSDASERITGGGVRIWPPDDSVSGPVPAAPQGVAATYLRISDDREGRELGVTRQGEDTLAAAIRAEASEVRRYCDNDIGASTKSRKRRPDFEKLIEDVEAGVISTVVYYTNARLTRRPAEYEKIISLVERTGVRLISVMSGAIDLTTADGRMLGRMLAAADAAEAERISERVTRAHQQRRATGQHHGGTHMLGYLKPDPEQGIGYLTHVDERAVHYFDQAMDMALADLGWTAIMDYWNAEGFHRLNGTPWITRDEVQSVLLSPTRAGLSVHHGQIVGAGTWPAVIDAGKWEKLVSRYSSSQRRGKASSRYRYSNPELAKPGQGKRKHPNSGVIRCGLCASRLRVKQPGGTRQDMYVCAKGIGGCGKIGRNKKWIDDLIKEYVLTRITEEYDAAPAESTAPQQIERLRAEIDIREERIGKTREAAKSGLWSIEDAGQVMRELRDEIDELKREIGGYLAQEQRDQTSQEDLIATWLDETPATVEARTAIVRRYVDQVIIHPLPRKGRWLPDNYPADSFTIIGR
ncbi:recombinase family protein [Streptosporangium sp. NPDC000509]|uniref:recombinase family protein n=1 Tax=Streptosporangium sp. NPDC000509 TaxID=3366186 RepID=UPI00368E8206